MRIVLPKVENFMKACFKKIFDAIFLNRKWSGQIPSVPETNTLKLN